MTQQQPAKFAWLIRTFATDSKDVSDRVSKALMAYQHIRSFTQEDPILFLVPEYKDCGDTQQELRSMMQITGCDKCSAANVPGNQNTDVLNLGMHYAQDFDCTHAVITSGKFVESITPTIYACMHAHIEVLNSLAVGVAVDPDFVQRVMSGLVLNACAVWNIQELLSVGGFNIEAPAGGVEEVAALVKLIEKYPDRKIISTIQPKKVQVPDVSPGTEKRRKNLVGSKIDRQNQVLASLGVYRQLIKTAVSRRDYDI